uniref:Folate_rec domain-containing protein n=1 Tax=Globodera pallida TaxID=36090 RepID=A0A183CHF9_GLOPA
MGVSNSGLVAVALLIALTLPGLSWGDDSASAPEEFTPCEKMMAKCTDNWGECFPRDGYKGDACCEKGASWKCSEKMNKDEMMSKDPTYAKMMNCFLAGHPDLESLTKCMPDKSECKSPRSCWINWRDFEVCPKLLKCVQPKTFELGRTEEMLAQNYNEKECATGPLPVCYSNTY